MIKRLLLLVVALAAITSIISGSVYCGATVCGNTTTGEYYTKVTNAWGWYLCDEGTSCMLATKTPYSVWGYKIGYQNSSTYLAVTQ